MSIRVMTAVWALELPAGEKLLLLALADCANDDGQCWPGMKNLRAKTGKGERSLQMAIKTLCAAGHLTREETPGKGCFYTVHPQATLPLTPAEIAPRKNCAPQKTTQTPAEIAPKPSKRTIIPKKDKPSLVARAKQKTPLPEKWTPRPLNPGTICAGIVAAWQPGRIERELSKFKDHHLKAGAMWVDWDAAWRTWVQNAGDFERGNNGRREQPDSLRGTRPSPALDMWRQANADIEAERGNSPADFGTRLALPPIRPG